MHMFMISTEDCGNYFNIYSSKFSNIERYIALVAWRFCSPHFHIMFNVFFQFHKVLIFDWDLWVSVKYFANLLSCIVKKNWGISWTRFHHFLYLCLYPRIRSVFFCFFFLSCGDVLDFCCWFFWQFSDSLIKAGKSILRLELSCREAVLHPLRWGSVYIGCTPNNPITRGSPR